MMPDTIRVLCASGGGMRGAFTGGVLHGLTESGVMFDAVCGVSTGSIAAGYLAQYTGEGQAPAIAGTYRDVWFGLRRQRDVFRGGIPRAVWRTLRGRSSWWTFEPLRRLLETHVTGPVRLPCALGVTNLDTGAYESVWPTTAIELHEAVLASAAIPVSLPPVLSYTPRWADGELGEGTPRALVDGGAASRVAPLTPAFQLARALAGLRRDEDGPEAPAPRVVVYMVNATPRLAARALPYITGWMDAPWWRVGLRALEVLEYTALQADVREAERVNELLKLFAAMPRETRRRYPRPAWLVGKVPADIVRFDPPRVFGGTLDVNPAHIRELWEDGYTAGVAHAKV